VLHVPLERTAGAVYFRCRRASRVRRRGRSATLRYATEGTIRIASLISILGVAFTACCASRAVGSPPTTTPSAVRVTGTRLTFDPKTATEGAGGFGWGLGSVHVTLRGHRDRRCEFDYQWEVEGAGNYQIYRVSVPLYSGPVVIDAEKKDCKDDHCWSGGVFTSFTANEATLIRSARFGWFVDPLEGTNESVTHRLLRPGDRDKPLMDGDTVSVRFLVYLQFEGGEFRNLAGEQWQRQAATVPLAGETEWKWVQHVLREMKLYEIRQVRLPVRVSGPAARWLPGYNEKSEIFVEMQAVTSERVRADR
jgi:hypothetical protein